METEKVVIMGTGPAGLTAAMYAARADLEPLVLDGALPGGQLTQTTEVENYPGFPDGVSGFDLVDAMRRQAQRFGARFETAVVTACDLSRRPFRLTLDNGKTIVARTLIVATGASAQYLGLPSEKALIGHGVSACATCDGAFFRGMPVAVVGGGDTAMEEAIFLTRFASKVYVIHRRDAFRASKIMADRVLAHPKIEVVWNSVVEEILDPAAGKVTGVKLRDVTTDVTRVLEAQGVFVAIGHKPNTEVFRGRLDMDERGYLVTKGVRTNVEGVFAAGDVQDPHYRQAITAAGSGCAAALEAEREAVE